MRRARGTARGLSSRPVIGRLTRESVPFLRRKGHILVSEAPQKGIGYAGQVVEGSGVPQRGITLGEKLDFTPGDIVSLNPDGTVFFLWEQASFVNALMVTESCNCRCIMCPQPPKPHEKALLRNARQVLSLVDKSYAGNVAISGGEPTLLVDDFINLLGECRRALPDCFINVLTNGKNFSNIELARKVALLGLERFNLCVSLHADTDIIHDEIVGRPGSFEATQKGIHNLAKFRLPVEIRVVVLKANYDRLHQIAEHIYRNYPFACHVTFMALEMTGEARENEGAVWVDPWEYRQELEVAVHELHRRGMRVSVYNHQLCVVDPRVRPFARQSISPWKNSYLPACESCGEKEACCGVFTTSGTRLSESISALGSRA